MRVLLRTEVTGVGKRGDVVDVSGGFARNFLLPAGRAIAATPGIEGQAAGMRRARDLREQRDRQASETVAQRIQAVTIKVAARAGSEGRLFGSVTAADLSEALLDQTGAAVDRRRVVLGEPIRSLGVHTVLVKLHSDVEARVTVEVVPEN